MRTLGAIVIGAVALIVATACTDDATDTTADWSVPTPGTLVDACVDGNRDDGGEYLVGSSLGTEGVATVAVDAGAEVEVAPIMEVPDKWDGIAQDGDGTFDGYVRITFGVREVLHLGAGVDEPADRLSVFYVADDAPSFLEAIRRSATDGDELIVSYHSLDIARDAVLLGADGTVTHLRNCPTSEALRPAPGPDAARQVRDVLVEGRGATPPATEPDWRALPPDRRQVVLGQTPADVLAELTAVDVRLVVPEEWLSQPSEASVAVRTDVGLGDGVAVGPGIHSPIILTAYHWAGSTSPIRVVVGSGSDSWPTTEVISLDGAHGWEVRLGGTPQQPTAEAVALPTVPERVTS